MGEAEDRKEEEERATEMAGREMKRAGTTNDRRQKEAVGAKEGAKRTATESGSRKPRESEGTEM